MKATVNASGNWSIAVGPRPEDLEILADRLEATIVPCSVIELQLLCAHFARRVAKLEWGFNSLARTAEIAASAVGAPKPPTEP